MKWFIFSILIAIGALCGVAGAQPAWKLTTADFKQRGVDLISLDEKGVTVAGEKGQSTVAMADFLQLDRSSVQAEKGGKFTLVLSSGDQIVGEPVEVANEQLKWKSSAVGEMTISMRQITAMLKTGQSAIAS